MPDSTLPPDETGPTNEFWQSSGYRLLERNADGYLTVTDDFIRAYLMRPELEPVVESCAAERKLHADLMENPFLMVPKARLDTLADQDVVENYELVLGFRDRLKTAGTVEGAYLAEFQQANVTLPSIFMHQMVHVILRNILEDCSYPFCLRAAEMLFREQKITLQEGAVLAADFATVEMLAKSGGFGDLGRLVAQGGTDLRQVDLDVMRTEIADQYWQRNEAYDLVVELNFGKPALDGLCRVLEWWVAHFLKASVRIEPVQKIEDEKWSWHIGLDEQANALLNELYAGEELDDERRERLVSLFRLTFDDPADMRDDLAGKPVYLAMAFDENKRLRLKPQNLLVNLPLKSDLKDLFGAAK
ncbi:MAG: DUF6352 family protein [Magnetovibrionaceae bacterium]